MTSTWRRTGAAVTTGIAVLAGACTASPDTTRIAGSTATTSTAPASKQHPPPTTAPKGAITFAAKATEARIGGCEIFPRDHFLNATGVDRLPVHPRSAAWTKFLARDDGRLGFPSSKVWEGARGGMPINIVDSRKRPMSSVVLNHNWTAHNYTGKYPIPEDPRLEGHPSVQWDQHLLMVDVADCNAYELIQYEPRMFQYLGIHTALAGTRYSLSTTDRPRMTTNAPSTPMIGQYAMAHEVLAGRVGHVVGFCTDAMNTQHVWPARASDGLLNVAEAPPTGVWLRLKSSVDVTKFTGQARTIVEALRRHGTVLTDTCGHRFHLMGENSDRWNDTETKQLRSLSPEHFEVVDTTPMKVSDSSFRIN
jgi:hypothetical protein